MEELTIQVEKIAGQAREGAECGVINKKITLADGEIGHLVCCLLVNDSRDSKRQETIRDILEITERRLEGAEGSILVVLKDILDASGRYLEEQTVQASFLLTFFYKNVCYVARRGEKVGLVIYENTKKSEIKFETGSGPVAAGQTYLIATSKFLELFDESTYSKEDLELSEIIDGLATEVSANEDQAEIGAVFVRAGEIERVSSIGDFEGSDPEGGDRTGGVTGDGKEIEEQADISGLRGESATGYEEVSDESADIRSKHVDNENSAAPRTNPVILLVRGLYKEISRIRKGDGRAIFRLRRNILIIAILIVVGLGGFAGYSIFQKSEMSKQQEVAGYIDSARLKLNEGSAIIELNKSRAREILIDAQKQAQKAQNINKNDPEVSKVLSEIESKLTQTEQTTSINFSTFAEVEFGLQSLAFNGSKIEAFGQDKIFEIDAGGKTIQDYEGVNGIKSGAVYDNKAYVLTGNEAVSLDFSSGKISKIADFVASDIGVFFGNVYLLGDDQITKFVPIEGGYAEPRDYLEKPEEFGSSSRMAIDSIVWVTKGNRVLKFNRGILENFEISGLPGGVGDFGLIFTDSSVANLYVVDRTNSVLLIIGKDGEYKKALSSEEFSKASDILVNDSEDKVYLSVGAKILSIGLK